MISKSDKKFSPKKLLVVGGIIFAVVIVIVIMIALFSGRSKTSTASNLDAGQRFSRYASYVLFGEGQNSLEGAYERGRAYELSRQFSGTEVDAEFWDKSKGLLNDAVKLYSENPSNTDLLTFLQEYQRRFLFLDAYKRLGEPSEEQILRTALESGSSGVATFVENFYIDIKSGNYSEEANDIIDAKIQQYNVFAELIAFYIGYGCLKGESLDEACAADLSERDELFSELLSKMNSSDYQAEKNLKTMVQRTESDCFRISRQFRELSQNKERNS